MKDEHIVPLSRQALIAFRELHKLTGHQEWLFPNSCPKINPVMSENVINLVIEKMGYKGRMVGHSFRALFSTILNEHELHSDAIERQLSHFERNAVKAAYNRAQYLGVRRQLMQYWADYLDSLSGVKVFDALADIGDLPARGPNADFHGARVFTGADSTKPSAFAHRN